MKNRIVKLSTLILLFLAMLTSCKKETIDPEDDSVFAASQSSTESAKLADEAEDEATYRLSPSIPAGTCPTITWSSPLGIFPNTVILDFGDGCTGRHGHRFRGQIKMEITAPYFEEGSVRTLSTNNLVIDGTHLTFSRVVTNGGLDRDNRMFWTVAVDLRRQKGNNGNVTTYNAARIRTIVAGAETEDLLDDSYSITGTASGILTNNREFSSTITTPLIKRSDCRWIVSGTEVTTVEGRKGAYTLDFGDGKCDDKATLTRPNGSTVEVTLGGEWRK